MANNPYVNKVVYGNTTLIDISDTTATAGDVANGKYLYLANGTKAQGSLVIKRYYTGNSTPSSSLGNNGDLYFQQS